MHPAPPPLPMAFQDYQVITVNVGNPHAIVYLANQPCPAQWQTLAYTLSQHACFPRGCNVSFVQQTAANALVCSVFERGAGATRSCGSAACATVAALHHLGHAVANNVMTVQQPGGTVWVTYRTPDNTLLLAGEAEYCFEGALHGTWPNAKTT